MKKITAVFVLLLAACAQPPEPPVTGDVSIVPIPQTVRRIGGTFALNQSTVIVAASDDERRAADLLNELLASRTNFSLEIRSEATDANAITVRQVEPVGNAEAYRLRVAPGSVTLEGGPGGLIYGVQTLAQMLPLEPEAEIQLPAAEIEDSPRFSYRGMHLDVARHFMPKDFVKKYIGLLAQYKFNYFHWHLTDDQGWRIEIKKYPRLTEVGSIRPETVVAKNYRPYVGDGVPVSGFYTQDEIREIVAFAKARNITIIPEIDVPGHSSAALAAYPEFGCRPNFDYKIKGTWGAFPDTLCPTHESLAFVDDLVAELVDLFPDSPYIHLGGDEVMTDQWRASERVRQIMASEQISSDPQMHGWFVRRVSDLIDARGRKPIAWDDVIETAVGPKTTIMVWQDAERGAQAARLGHNVIMAPWRNVYLDHPQGDTDQEPLALGEQVTLEDAYAFDPIPEGLTGEQRSRILGGQGCLWTEFIKKPDHVEYMAFPRALALAEVLWSGRERSNFQNFYERLGRQLAAFDKQGIHYRIPKPLGLLSKALAPAERAIIDLKKPTPGSTIHYTVDGTRPGEGSPTYRGPFVIDVPPEKIVTLKAMIRNPNGRSSSVFTAEYSRIGPRSATTLYQK